MGVVSFQTTTMTWNWWSWTLVYYPLTEITSKSVLLVSLSNLPICHLPYLRLIRGLHRTVCGDFVIVKLLRKAIVKEDRTEDFASAKYK